MCSFAARAAGAVLDARSDLCTVKSVFVCWFGREGCSLRSVFSALLPEEHASQAGGGWQTARKRQTLST